jgi:hypothetical protein
MNLSYITALTIPPSDDESSSASSTATLRRAQALILFVANALRQSPSGFLAQTDIKEGAVETILSKLLDLSSPEKLSAKELTGVISASQIALSCVLKVSSVAKFVQTVALVLQSGVVSVSTTFIHEKASLTLQNRYKLEFCNCLPNDFRWYPLLHAQIYPQMSPRLYNT